MNDDTSFDKAAKTPVRVLTVSYAVLKVLFFNFFYFDYALIRLISSVVMIVLTFILTGSQKLTRRQLSVFVPISLVLIELVTVSLSDGDRLTYIFLIGCSLVSLMYVDVIGLFIMISLSSAITAFFILVLDIRLFGVNYALSDDVFNFTGMVLIYVLIFLLGNYTVRTLYRFRQTGQTFDKILETSPNLIVIVNEMARVEYISKSFVDLLGIEKQEYAINLPFIDLFPSVRKKIFFGNFLRQKGSFEETFDIEINGKQRWFIIRSVKGDESKVARLFEGVEITPIVEAQRAAEAATRSKSEFLATMSHEIRTPMNAIIGVAQIQLQKENLPDEYVSALEMIYASGNSLLGIINDILDMSKIETGKLELNPMEYDIPSLINDAIQLNVVRIGSKQIEFKLDIDETLPSRLYGDELRLKQILNNLLSNAIKYTEKGFVKLSVRHLAIGEDVMLYFTVEDSGQGMKSGDKELLFSEYLRFNVEANRSTEGTGLGLNITKKLVDMMDGGISVESEYGKGSVFTVLVKQKAVDCRAIGAELAEKLRNFKFTGDAHTKLKIIQEPMPYGSVLVVDDVATNLFVAEGLLSPYKLSIETADSGFSAINKVESGKTYDIIFMDHMMPQMDGIETTQKLRGNGYKGVIVALTANALVGNDEMFAQNGFDGFIPKPINVRQLNEVLKKFIRDKYPEEAKKYKPETVQTETANKNQKLLKIFRGDAEKAVVTLRETAANGNIKLFTTTAHAMKSALANVGENEASALAAALEKAGLDGDNGYISANTESFTATLDALIKNLTPEETADSNVTEDSAYLAEQLQIIKKACEDYDDTTAYAALDRLKEKQWKAETSDALEKIHDALFLHSDFDGAASMAAKVSA